MSTSRHDTNLKTHEAIPLNALTPHQLNQADAIIDAHRDTPGSLITVLRLCQDIVGYFPTDLIVHIARGMNLPLSKVYGVVSFYSLFSLKPKGRHQVRVCTGTACYVRGVREVLDRVERRFDVKAGSTCADRRFSLEPVRCLGACGLAPVMVVDRDTHGGVTPDSACEILEAYE
jgi:NADH:ubiquinone oxidoreductase subunit E